MFQQPIEQCIIAETPLVIATINRHDIEGNISQQVLFDARDFSGYTLQQMSSLMALHCSPVLFFPERLHGVPRGI